MQQDVRNSLSRCDEDYRNDEILLLRYVASNCN